jgi:hypothetical protein
VNRWPYRAEEIIRNLEEPELCVSDDPMLIELISSLRDR